MSRRLLLAAGGGSSFLAGINDPTLPALDLYQRTVLTTPTYDGSGQAVHPSVVKITGGWNGWLYWMAMTPYPSGDAAYENPSILVSNDGFTWQVPDGLTNPVAPNLGTYANSDSDLVYYAGTLYLFYRDFLTTTEHILLRTSTDGITWSAPTTLITASANGNNRLSPSVVRASNGTWWMWYVNANASPNQLEYVTASDPAGPWSGPTACTASDPEGRDLWHLDVVADGAAFKAVITTCTSGTSGTAGRMLLASSADGVTWTISSAVLSPTGSGWDGSIVYRGSPVYEQSRWRCWYSGMQTGTVVWRIGYTELDPADFP